MAGWLRGVLSVMAFLASGAAAAAVDTTELDGPLNVVPYMDVLPDGQGRDLARIRAEPPGHWRSADGDDALNFSFDEDAWWVRLRLTNPSDIPVQRLFEVATPLQDNVELHVVKQREVVASHLTGNRRPFGSRPVHHRHFVFPVELAPDSEVTLYLRLDTHDGLHEAVPLTLWTYGDFNESSQQSQLIYGLYYGALLAMLLYNALIFSSTREPMYLHYVVYLGAFFVWNFTFRGFALQYWWPDWPTLNSQLVPLTSIAIYLGLALFTVTYLNTREWAPRLHRGIVGFGALILVLIVPAVLDWYALTFALMVPLAVVFLLYLMVVAAVLMRRGSRPARFYLLAWGVLMAGAVLYYLQLAGVLPANALTNNALQIGSALEFMLLALGLADKINTLKAENLAAKHRIVEQQREHADRLERTVKERTGELRAVNQQLADMAVTDELTGLYNRRRFNEELERAVDAARRTGHMLAFCMVDVDAFKAYNDQYGHEAGDHALVALADAVRTQLRRPQDRIFRVGGEEFGILLQTDDCESARRFLEEVRQSIVDRAIPHEASTDGCLTASFGLYCHQGGPDLPDATTIYQLADEALYAAKRGGRNRVEVVVP